VTVSTISPGETKDAVTSTSDTGGRRPPAIAEHAIAREAARVPIPTAFGEFDARAFEAPSGDVYLALVRGEVEESRGVLTRLHSECLTGDALGSRRCDCGQQLESALRAIAAEGTGVLLYATGQEGRGIGLVNKLRAYAEQDRGADTVEANVRLGLPIDGRSYDQAAAVLRSLGVRSVRLLTNNPRKVRGLRRAGVEVDRVEPLPTAANLRNVAYLETKRRRMGHVHPAGTSLDRVTEAPPDVTSLLGEVRPHPWRPYVVLKYAQSLDGRIATSTGDSRWISGEPERMASHALRAACDAVMVGVGTVLRDDCRLTVRLVPGSSPVRVVVDSTLRIPLTAAILSPEAATVVVTTERSSPIRRQALLARHVAVRVAEEGADGVDLSSALRILRSMGIRSLLVEGGSRLITSALAAGVVDRLIVGVAPRILGAGTDAVGDLGVDTVRDGLRLANRSVHLVEEDLLLAWDVVPAGGADAATADAEPAP
jgi:GTP cyclohydrolase II